MLRKFTIAPSAENRCGISRCRWPAALAALVLFGGDASAAEPVAKIETRLVLVPVTVTDRNGTPLMDLKAGDFRILDGDQPRPIHSLSREDAPVSVGIVVDLSGSMRNKLQEAMTAVREIATALDDDDAAARDHFRGPAGNGVGIHAGTGVAGGTSARRRRGGPHGTNRCRLYGGAEGQGHSGAPQGGGCDFRRR